MASDGWIRVHKSDLEKVRDVLVANEEHHKHRDQMNAAIHLAHLGNVRHSPITSQTIAERERVDELLDQAEAS